LTTPYSHAFWSSSATPKQEKEDETKDPYLLVSPIVNREIKVSVKANWPSSPSNVLCEAWAFLKHWDFLDQLVLLEVNKLSPSPSYPTMTAVALQAAEAAGIPNVPLLHYALSMRAASPTCEMHRGLAQEALLSTSTMTAYQASSTSLQAFCVLAPTGAVVTDPNDCQLPPMIMEEEEDESESSGRGAMIMDDWLLPGEVPRGADKALLSKGLVILYANLSSASFRIFYQRLVELEIPFVVRHYEAEKEEANHHHMNSMDTHTTLQGYGVRLDIRNVEYKVFDDTKDQEEMMKKSLLNVSALDTVVPHQFLAGVNLTALNLMTTDTDEDNNHTLKYQET
jgi:hypothetical protein